MRLSEAVQKNFDESVIGRLQGNSHRLVGFSWQVGDITMTPFIVIFCFIKLFYLMGPTFLIGLSIFFAMTRFDSYFHKLLGEEHRKNHKVHEKMGRLTDASLNNAKFLKFYNWDDFFKKEVEETKKEEIKRSVIMERYYIILTFMWIFFNDILSQVSFAAYFGFGYSLNLAQAMEILLYMDKVRGPLDRLTRLRQEIADIRLAIM